MRNTRRGEFRLTSALSARAVEIASEICRANHLLSGLRAREGRGEPLTRLALLKWLLKLAALLIRSGADTTSPRRRGVRRASRDRTDPQRQRLAPAAAACLWDMG